MMINAQQHFFPLQSHELKNYPLFTLFGYPITTPKTYPGGEELCNKVHSSYKQLIKEGVIDETHKILVSDLANYQL